MNYSISALKDTLNTLNESINLYRKTSIQPGMSLVTKENLESNFKPEELDQVRISLESYNEIIKEGPGQDSAKTHLSKFLDKYNLKVDPKIFTDIKETDFIEIYSKGNKQIFRSVNFFSLCSYNLSSLTFMPWDQLFYRNPADLQSMSEAATYILSNDIPYYIPPIPEHSVLELETEKRFKYKLKFCGCVFDKDTDLTVAYVTVASAREITTNLRVLN